MRKISLKYAGKCAKCGRWIQAGKIAYWEQGKGIWHVECYEDHREVKYGVWQTESMPRRHLAMRNIPLAVFFLALMTLLIGYGLNQLLNGPPPYIDPVHSLGSLFIAFLCFAFFYKAVFGEHEFTKRTLDIWFGGLMIVMVGGLIMVFFIMRDIPIGIPSSLTPFQNTLLGIGFFCVIGSTLLLIGSIALLTRARSRFEAGRMGYFGIPHKRSLKCKNCGTEFIGKRTGEPCPSCSSRDLYSP